MKRTALLHFIRRAAQAVPSVVEHLSADAWLALKAANDMPTINSTYHDRVSEALAVYFEGGSITAPKNSFKRATVEAFTDAFFLGYQDGGGNIENGDAELNAWLDARINAEFGYIDMLFEQAKALRQDAEFDSFAWVSARADSYTGTLASIYNSGMLFAKKNQMLTWRLGATETHCATCSNLNGKAHRAKWYVAHDYIPRKPGAAMDCGGYNCDCRLEDPEGNEITI